MNKFDRQIEQAKRIIDNLPQRNVMKEEDIANWLATKLKEDPERLIWHARRLGCFGGSDIGVLVAEMRNNNATSVDQQYHIGQAYVAQKAHVAPACAAML